MKKTLYIHAGLHKTGTSSIQVELTRARHILASIGFLYPQSGIPHWAPYGQHLLPWSLVKNSDLVPSDESQNHNVSIGSLRAIWDELRQEIEAADLPNVIISSEEFDILNRGELDELSIQLSGYEIIPIIFLRNLSDFVESGYGTAVMFSGMQVAIEQYVNHHRSRTDFHQLLLDWKAISTNQLLRIVSYDDEHLKRDVVQTFLRLIGLGADAIEPVRLPFQNESASPIAVEIVRHLRTLGASSADIATWKATLSSAPITKEANSKYTLLPQSLRQLLDFRYMEELDSIGADQTLASMVLGQLVLPQKAERTQISGIQAALAAFSKELELLNPAQS